MTSARRVRGLLLAMVLGLSQASAWVHAAAVSHATCLEHGESVHAVGEGAAFDDHGASPAAEAEAEAEAANADRATSDVTAAAAHDHCASSALLRWRDVTLTAPPASAELPPVVHGSTAAAPSPDGQHVAAVYLVAPKTSPPHADA
jgi:hypothetical protein